ncbi:MAG TPA: hypothetical protein VFD15_07095, partial [Clostridia bacterium]|nr:hypothetical protein [Clostridia bacterium]
MFKKCLQVLVILVFMLCGCAEFTGDSAGKIIPPSNQIRPLDGCWKVVRELVYEGDTEKTVSQWMGGSIQFAENAVIFNGYVWDNPSYKIKKVDATGYFKAKYISPSGFSLPVEQMVEVVTVYTDSNFHGELMKLSDTVMIFFIQERGLLLEKTTCETNGTLNSAGEILHGLSGSPDEGTSGIFLGLRITTQGKYTYQTLWIASDHKKLCPVLAVDQIFFPRMGGFWELEVNDIYTDGERGNTLTAYNVVSKSLEAVERPPDGDSNGREPSVKVVNYIGNDYVAVQEGRSGTNKLKMLPIDKLSTSTAIKVNDLLGEEGLAAYTNARETAIKSLKDMGITGVTHVGEDGIGENFSLARENGHWYFFGRINYQDGEIRGEKDFRLKVLPPENLIFYDTLKLNW